jgi:hypothetical protein
MKYVIQWCSVCTAIVAGSSSTALADFFLSYIGPDAGWTGGFRNFYSTDAGGRVRAKTYMTRDGYPMLP